MVSRPPERRLTTAELEARLAELKRASDTQQRAIIELETEIAINRVEDEDFSLREKVFAAAVGAQTISISSLRHVPWASDYTLPQLERALQFLVAAGRLEDTDQLGMSATGRGRGSRIYRVTGDYSDTARMQAREVLATYDSTQRGTGEVPAITDEPEAQTSSTKKSKRGAK